MSATWKQLAPATTPDPRYQFALAYDAARAKVVMFGGFGDSLNRGDTLTWNGGWTLLSPAASPSARSGHAMVYDGTNTNVVLFGGGDIGSAFKADTWLWGGTNWTHPTPATSPPGRNGHAMVYDPDAGKVWLFGGAGAGGLLNDLWSWDGTTWTNETPVTSPVVRTLHALAYDGARGEVVMYGGVAGSPLLNTNLDDTWTLSSAGVWTHKTPTHTPARNDDTLRDADHGRLLHALAYDEELELTILYGGAQLGVGRAQLGDTLTWDGTDWTELVGVTGPPTQREGSVIVYDAARGYALLFGGQGAGGSGSDDTFDETWILDAIQPASIRHTFGLG